MSHLTKIASEASYVHCQLNPNAPKNPETFDFEGELGFDYETNVVK